MTILVIVESPNKVAKLSQILGKKYIVKASMGNFRDLDPKKMSIDFDNHFNPIYIITKPDVVKKLKSAMKNVTMVYLATDQDREGAQIAQSLYDVLKPKKYKRLRFNAIEKTAITNAINNAGPIEKDIVNAQKARRVLDRLFGYLISPLLQKQFGGNLSAGRVQSVTTKIVIDKENEIKNFLEKNSQSSYFRVYGFFSKMKTTLHESMDKKPYLIKDAYKGKTAHISIVSGDEPNINVITFLKKCLKSDFVVHSISNKITTKLPAPPFITSTLLQEANRKFGMSVDLAMKTAQKLYEGGYITYIRTDSVELSPEGQEGIKKVIEEKYGKKYYQKNIYKNQSANTQEAHEAIRPTHPDILSLEKEVDDKHQIKLYKLIWQRTIASQMKPAKIDVTIVQINISKYIKERIEPYYYFQSQLEKIQFPGFMIVYIESVDDPIEDDETIQNFTGKIPLKGDKLIMEEITAKQEYLKPPPRYSEASLVKKLKQLGIGRPSTYVNTIKTIINREYIEIVNVPGIKKDVITYTIKSENNKPIMSIFEDNGTVLLGKETKKFIPTNLGITINDFLVENFPEMMDYKFTAKIEKELDAISNGEKIWHIVVKNFYDKLIPIINELSKNKGNIKIPEKLLGIDKEGTEIYAIKTKYGPRIKKIMNSKIVYGEICKPLTFDTIELKDAIKIFEYPKIIGKYKSIDVYLNKGKHGFYISYDKENYSIGKENVENIDIKKAIQIIDEKNSKYIAVFNLIERKKKIKANVINGIYGPYIQAIRGKKRTNYPIAKNIDPKSLTNDMVLQIISGKKTFKKPYAGSKTSKKSTKK